MSIETGIETGIETPRIYGYHYATKRQKEVLHLIIKNDSITYSEMKKKLGIKTDRGLSKHIDKLKELGALQREGTYDGKWIIIYEK